MSGPPLRCFRQRWARVEARLKEESQVATDENRFAQLEALMDSVDDFGWREALDEGDDEVRQLWCRLREVLTSETSGAPEA